MKTREGYAEEGEKILPISPSARERLLQEKAQGEANETVAKFGKDLTSPENPNILLH